MKKMTRAKFAKVNKMTYMRKNDPIKFDVLYNEYCRKFDSSYKKEYAAQNEGSCVSFGGMSMMGVSDDEESDYGDF